MSFRPPQGGMRSLLHLPSNLASCCPRVGIRPQLHPQSSASSSHLSTSAGQCLWAQAWPAPRWLLRCLLLSKAGQKGSFLANNTGEVAGSASMGFPWPGGGVGVLYLRNGTEMGPQSCLVTRPGSAGDCSTPGLLPHFVLSFI